jgi:phosphoadenosine phosphosulfate reductase
MRKTAISHRKQEEVSLDIDQLNEQFKPLHYTKRIELLYDKFEVNDVLFSSSFGTKSVFLIYLIQLLKNDQKIHFVDTTFHFPETIHYKHLLTEKYQLDVIDLHPDPIQNKLTEEEEWWGEHPNMCCTVNKIVPLEDVVINYKVWISGLMAFQTAHRSRLRIFEQQGDILKFHPLIDISEEEYLFRKGYHNLPLHPLEQQGYGSVGCMHCTAKGGHRTGRWSSSGRMECGLHTNYFFRNDQ